MASLTALTNHPGEALLPWCPTSRSKSPVGMQNAVVVTVSLSMAIWWNDDTRLNRGKVASFSQGIEDLVDARDGELSEGADWVELLVVDRNSDADIFVRNRYHRGGVRRSGVLDEVGRQVLVKHVVDLFSEDGVDALLIRSASDGWAVRWTESLNGTREHKPKSHLNVEKTSGSSQRMSPRAVMAVGDKTNCGDKTLCRVGAGGVGPRCEGSLSVGCRSSVPGIARGRWRGRIVRGRGCSFGDGDAVV